MYSLTKDNFLFSKKNFNQSPQNDFMKETKNMEKLLKLLTKKNYCDKYFNKKVLALYLKDFRKSKNNGFVIWQYISLNSFC